MKKATKITILILCVLFTVITIVSCNEKSGNDEVNDEKENNTDTENTAEEATKSYYDALGEMDFGGKTISLLDSNDHPEFFQNFAEELIGEPMNDSMYNRDRFLEEKYNVNIKWEMIVPTANGTNKIQNAINAGLSGYDIVISPACGSALNKLSTNHMLCNLIELPYVSLTSPWWNQMSYENLTYNGALYYTMGDISTAMYGAASCFFYNKNLVQDYGIDTNFYKLVEEGQWTYDVLAKITKDMDMDMDGNGKIRGPNDFYGVVGQEWPINSDILLTGAGAKLASVKKGEGITVDLNGQDVLDKIDKLSDIFKATGIQGWDHIRITFFNDLAIFMLHNMSTGYSELRNMTSDYGILPVPKYDEKQESYYNLVNPWATVFAAVPINTEDLEITSFIVEAMAYSSYIMVRPPTCENMLKQKAARDEQSMEIIDTIINTSYIDFGAIYNFGGVSDHLCNAVFSKKDFVSAYEKIEGKIEKDINDLQDAFDNK